jgi:hypothetical protein
MTACVEDPDLCEALCPVHAGRNRRRGRFRCARPRRSSDRAKPTNRPARNEDRSEWSAAARDGRAPPV